MILHLLCSYLVVAIPALVIFQVNFDNNLVTFVAFFAYTVEEERMGYDCSQPVILVLESEVADIGALSQVLFPILQLFIIHKTQTQ